ncbi:fibrobacter succinogenes major paralogous domain-containing protein [Lacibacter sediminis]|uniref:Fibrobacter succinogenes major paralogous domain-containing protein n=2 Tax=Lacibacter sediminis TaxID=2760713 RepID=A0A7G5XN19_9BACT|nr:fibrobacter succinogenes major paralogous domain-containing protein [Lacibacter sediminis]
MLYWDGTKWTTLPKGTNGQYLKWCNDTLTWGPCLPVINTKAVKNVNDHPQAIVDVAVLSDGGSYILEFGICVSKNPNPTYPNDQVGATYPNTQLGITQFGFDTESNTTYYVRAFAVSNVGVAYGNELSVTSKTFSAPVVLLDSISSIGTSSAILWGTVSNEGSFSVSQKGFVWDTIPNVSITNNLLLSTSAGNSNYSTDLLNLKPNKRYYVRAYAGNAHGNSYSAEQSFITDTIPAPPPPPPPPPAPTSLTDIDGNVYPVVKIANKHWISKNLDVTHYKNGDSIPQVQDAATWANLTTGAWCYYENQTANGTTYGKLYNWYAMNDPRGIAPAGWHVPNDEEWVAMIDSLGGSGIAGGKLKATTLWNSPNTGATNSSGFNGLPGGARLPRGVFDYKGMWGQWWSSTPSQMSNDLGIFLQLTNESQGISGPNPFEKQYGYSIRLIWNY